MSRPAAYSPPNIILLGSVSWSWKKRATFTALSNRKLTWSEVPLLHTMWAEAKNWFLIKMRLHLLLKLRTRTWSQISDQLTTLHLSLAVVWSAQRGWGEIINLNKMFNLLIIGQDPRGWKWFAVFITESPCAHQHKAHQPEGRHRLFYSSHWAFCALISSVGVEKEVFGGKKVRESEFLPPHVHYAVWGVRIPSEKPGRQYSMTSHGRLSSLRAFETLQFGKNYPAQVVLKQCFSLAEKSRHGWSEMHGESGRCPPMAPPAGRKPVPLQTGLYHRYFAVSLRIQISVH